MQLMQLKDKMKAYEEQERRFQYSLVPKSAPPATSRALNRATVP